MPAYTFRCRVCGEVFTRRYGFHDDLSAVTCPQGHREVERVFVPPAVVFKGSGFYVTDHRRDGRTGEKSKPASKAAASAQTPPSAAGQPAATAAS